MSLLVKSLLVFGIEILVLGWSKPLKPEPSGTCGHAFNARRSASQKSLVGTLFGRTSSQSSGHGCWSREHGIIFSFNLGKDLLAVFNALSGGFTCILQVFE